MDYEPKGSCALNYEGPLCSECSEGFTRNSRFECSRCPPLAQNISILAILEVGLIALLAVFIWLTLRSMVKAKSHFSIYFRLLVSHGQMLMLLATFRFD